MPSEPDRKPPLPDGLLVLSPRGLRPALGLTGAALAAGSVVWLLGSSSAWSEIPTETGAEALTLLVLLIGLPLGFIVVGVALLLGSFASEEQHCFVCGSSMVPDRTNGVWRCPACRCPRCSAALAKCSCTVQEIQAAHAP